MDIWKVFEKRIETESSHQGITCIKVPEHVIQAKGKSFRKKTKFDFCAGVDGVAAFFDAKSTARDFYLEHYVLAAKKRHQYAALIHAHENGNIAGYLLWFYQDFQIAWAPIKLVESLLAKGVTKITPDTPGLTVQMDNVPINLRTLLWEDRSNLVRKVCK